MSQTYLKGNEYSLKEWTEMDPNSDKSNYKYAVNLFLTTSILFMVLRSFTTEQENMNERGRSHGMKGVTISEEGKYHHKNQF